VSHRSAAEIASQFALDPSGSVAQQRPNSYYSHVTGDLYVVLGVVRDADDAELRRAYEYKLAEAQRAGGVKLAQEIDRAYSILRNPASRRRYDLHGFVEPPRAAPEAFSKPVPFRAWSPDGTPTGTRRGVSGGGIRKWLLAVAVVVLAGVAIGIAIHAHTKRTSTIHRIVPRGGHVRVICEPGPGLAGYSFKATSGSNVYCRNGAVPRFERLPKHAKHHAGRKAGSKAGGVDTQARH
jgi:hypothetical protein